MLVRTTIWQRHWTLPIFSWFPTPKLPPQPHYMSSYKVIVKMVKYWWFLNIAGRQKQVNTMLRVRYLGMGLKVLAWQLKRRRPSCQEERRRRPPKLLSVVCSYPHALIFTGTYMWVVFPSLVCPRSSFSSLDLWRRGGRGGREAERERSYLPAIYFTVLACGEDAEEENEEGKRR